jgi:hypothetical protein
MSGPNNSKHIDYKALISKYHIYGVDSSIVQVMFMQAKESERKRLLDDDNYFLDLYQSYL